MSVSLEARLKRLEDIEEIRRVILDHCRLLDEGNVQAFVDLFAVTDAEWLGSFGVFKGRKEIEAAATHYAKTPDLRVRNCHLVSPSVIEVHGDKGKAWSRFTVTTRNNGKPPALVVAGVYEDDFVQEAAGWKFRRHVITAETERA